MASVTRFPATASQNNGNGGTASWTSIDNIKANDSNYAYWSTNTTATKVSYNLLGTNFGFSIPTGATVDGIEIKFVVSNYYVSSGGFTFQAVSSDGTKTTLGSSGTIATRYVSPPTTWSTFTYGGATNKLGLTLTPEECNNSNFGLNLYSYMTEPDAGGSHWVSYETITIYYTEVSGPVNLKTVNGLAKASVKVVNGLAIASVKGIDGLT